MSSAVPRMRAPNEHAKDFLPPSKLVELLPMSKGSVGTATSTELSKRPFGILKKAKGLQSLTIGLSWM